MRPLRLLPICALALLGWPQAHSQTDRIPFNGQQLFLSGSNLAWVRFSDDLGSGRGAFEPFADILLQTHDHGGNSIRWWLHTDGTHTPIFNDSNFVTGPGEGTLDNLKRGLDLAWEREVGVDLCLWSFDMLRASNDAAVLQRNILLLTDTAYTRSYIDHCLIPMIKALKGHPAIVAWEIFNEAEGMSNEFGWSDVLHVPMSSIQRFVNLCAGAIHRADPAARVTTGVWSFKALTDVPEGTLTKTGGREIGVAAEPGEGAAGRLLRKYRSALTVEQAALDLEHMRAMSNHNYYTNDRLIAAGGDPDGTLDFYSVHYYDWGGTSLSPFHHGAGAWGLDKPIVVAEFAMQNTFGVRKEDLSAVLMQGGYAGALAWSWTDAGISSANDMLSAMQQLWDNHRQDVDVQGIGGDWPTVAITSPSHDSACAAGTAVRIDASASDPDGSVALVQFAMNDTTVVVERSSPPYTVTMSGLEQGRYSLTAAATDNGGHIRNSSPVQITVGAPAFIRMEAEQAAVSGSLSAMFDRAASGGVFLTMQQSGTITWTVAHVRLDGTYDLFFRYRLPYGSPRIQSLVVNGERAAEIVFDGGGDAWRYKRVTTTLHKGSNSVQIGSSWGWMDLDYLDLPADIFAANGEPIPATPVAFELKQNYPNPFNPTTVISYQLPALSVVTLRVYDVLGREVATLVNGEVQSGDHQVIWEAIGRSSGVYFYRLQARSVSALQTGQYVETKKMLIVR